MGKAQYVNPMEAMLGPRRKHYDGTCKLPGCNDKQADGLVVCERHKQKAERDFYAQIGLDPLFHLKHDVHTFPEWTWIYFVGSREHGVVKIGRTCRLKHRMMTLKNGAPVPVKLFAVVFGRPEIEAALHQRFAADRMHGEWFKLSGKIDRCIEDIKTQNFAKYVPEGYVPSHQERIERALKGMAESVLMHADASCLSDKLNV